MNVKNKIVLVTGAAKGIGLATVKRLLKKRGKSNSLGFPSR